jgi:uncharacterized integral membrane protein (TIGR00697 family)
MTESKNIVSHGTKVLWFLVMTYTVTILLANWFDIRLIQIGPFMTDAGTLIFPLSFIISDTITEVYGYKEARRAIWCGFLFNLLFLGYGSLVTHLPSPEVAPYNSEFDTLMTFEWRVIIASIISYFCAEPLNAYILAKLKLRWQGRHMAARFVSSTLFASAVDTTVFTSLAFYGLMPTEALITMALTMWLIKVAIEVLGLPFSLRLARYLKKVEHRDIYDRHTQFGMWHWEANYKAEDNGIMLEPKNE